MSLFDWLKRATGYNSTCDVPNASPQPADLNNLSAEDLMPKFGDHVTFRPSRNHRSKELKMVEPKIRMHGQRYTTTDIKRMTSSMMFDILNRHENKGAHDLQSLRQAFRVKVIKAYEKTFGSHPGNIGFNDAKRYYLEMQRRKIHV